MERARGILPRVVSKAQEQTASPYGMGQSYLDPLHIARAGAEFWGHYMRRPTRLVEWQMQYVTDMGHLWQQQQEKFLSDRQAASASSGEKKGGYDRRFRDPLWHQNVAFDFMRQAYLLTRQSVQAALNDADHLTEGDRRKLEFYTRLFMDAMAPTNFATTNPEVIRETLRSGGDNLLKGLENLIEDLERGQGALKISTTDLRAFRPGHNLAVTPGVVIYRGRMMELVQYTPTTPKVQSTPIMIVPPWINKYYILDLRPENSLVKYLVDQGFTVFMISWVNPDASYADVNFDDYLIDGWIKALDVVQTVMDRAPVHVMGYCIGGTLTAMGLAWLTAKKQAGRVAAATMLTTLLDFEHAGDMKVFIDEDQLEELEGHMQANGVLEAEVLQKTFSMLRANDMIWSFVVNNYLLGREPFPFDILYWNQDSTNLPAAFHSYYLRHMYWRNDLVKPKALTIGGVPIDLTTIKTPLYFISTREDHIAPWLATFDGARLIATKNKNLRFVLAASGHVAGVVNPPAAEKYHYWVGPAITATSAADAWLEGAKQHQGSWWTDWTKWAKSQSGKTIKSTKASGHKKYPVLDAAPGRYVLS
jgi:polyhydroxyalkanoate synthase